MARAVLTDFGLAKAMATGSRYTRSGEALGTPAYMSPEQARGEIEALTAATDAWSLGVVLFELLAGRPPFEGDTAAGVIGHVLSAEPVPVRRIRPDIPPGVAEIVQACLSKDPRRRYRTARDLREDLDRVLRGERPTARPARAWRGRAAAGVTAALLAGTLGWILTRPTGPPPPPPAIAPAVAAAIDRAERAWVARLTDPAGAARELESAVQAVPQRHDWRIRLGLLRWVTGDGPGALASWSAVPVGAREATRALWLRGLLVACRALNEAEGSVSEAGSRPWEDAASGRGVEARWARAGLALLDGDILQTRSLLEGQTGWEPALLRGLAESAAAVRLEPGSAEAGVRAYTEALADGLPFAWVLLNRGLLRGQAGDAAGARADHEAAVAADPALVASWFQLGALAVRAGDHPAALRACEEALRREPGHRRAQTNRGIARMGLQDLAGALADFDHVLAEEPGQAVALAGRGTTRFHAGDRDGARADLGRLLALTLDDLDAFVGRARLRDQLDDPTGAVEDYTEALARRPGSAAVLAWRADVRGQVGDLAGARADLDASLALRPDDAETLTSRGLARSLLGDPAGARADYDAAVVAAPRAWRPRLNRAVLRVGAGDVRGALEDLDAAAAAAPDRFEVRSGRAELRARAGDLAGAATEAEAALALLPPGVPERGPLEALLARAREGGRR